MAGMIADDWRNFGAGAKDRFHFIADDGANASAMLSAADAALPAERLVEEMARLAGEAYDKTAAGPVADGWRAFTAGELGLSSKGSGSVDYRFADGVYRGDTAQSSEGQALVLSRTVGDETVLTVAFRGTENLAKQFPDYFPFDKHYANFKPLITAVKAYVADAANGIDKVVVTGHSLGGAMAQLFMKENMKVPVEGYTFGSPGADKAPKGARLTNFAHENDVVPALGGVKDVRSGGVVTIDKNGLTGISAPHSIERYVETSVFLSGQAEDEGGPFHAHALAEAIRTGGGFVGDIRLEIGSDGDDALRPFAEDRFSLAGDGDDWFDIRRGELLPEQKRVLDGGIGDDGVLLPYARTRKGDGAVFLVAERKDGGMALKYDAATGSKDSWKTVGFVYRTETVVYDNGKSETIAEMATKIAHKGDLIVA